MQLQSYYDILGLPATAGNGEIKAAFRRLAKLYHPDKNPDGKEHFEKILMAYEVLIDAQRRRQYDIKLQYGKTTGAHSAPKTAKKKEWTFTEEELRRRQYYRENYRKEFQRSQYSRPNAYSEKKIYNEYKYILFAAPLAVALMMFVVNGLDRDNPPRPVEMAEVTAPPSGEINMGEDPYSGFFRNPVFDADANRTVTLKNLSGTDGVICLFGKHDRFLRCCYIRNNYQVELSQLPAEDMTIRLAFGNNWNRLREFKEQGVIGGFDDPQGYFVMKNDLKDLSYPITLDKATLDGLARSSEKEFFAR